MEVRLGKKRRRKNKNLNEEARMLDVKTKNGQRDAGGFKMKMEKQ